MTGSYFSYTCLIELSALRQSGERLREKDSVNIFFNSSEAGNCCHEESFAAASVTSFGQ